MKASLMDLIGLVLIAIGVAMTAMLYIGSRPASSVESVVIHELNKQGNGV